VHLCPPARPRPTPLLFIHGAYAAAWCWEDHFLPFFAEAGYAAHALSLSGHGGSPGRRHLDSFSIADYVRDVAQDGR
jgi:pimeloyl-ACP methyl ester carboxylesterase